jgi:hypothetical protein
MWFQPSIINQAQKTKMSLKNYIIPCTLEWSHYYTLWTKKFFSDRRPKKYKCQNRKSYENIFKNKDRSSPIWFYFKVLLKDDTSKIFQSNILKSWQIICTVQCISNKGKSLLTFFFWCNVSSFGAILALQLLTIRYVICISFITGNFADTSLKLYLMQEIFFKETARSFFFRCLLDSNSFFTQHFNLFEGVWWKMLIRVCTVWHAFYD